jgi:hypothetical protein
MQVREVGALDSLGACVFLPSSLICGECLLPLYPGQFHNIRLNLFNIVLVLDLSRSAALHTLTDAVANIVARGLPFRFGVVPLRETEEGTSSFCIYVCNRWTSAD